jgi:hypothetical protein
MKINYVGHRTFVRFDNLIRIEQLIDKLDERPNFHQVHDGGEGGRGGKRRQATQSTPRVYNLRPSPRGGEERSRFQ